MSGYVVTCSHSRSAHAAAFISAACARNQPPAGVLVVNPLNIHQLREQMRRHGARRLFEKVLAAAQALFRPHAGSDDGQPLLRWLEERQLPREFDIRGLCKRHCIPYYVVPNLNSDRTIGVVTRHAFRYAVYLGGGILREQFISAFSGPVLNAHQGPLPEIRGMGAIAWSLYLGLEPSVTLHGIDAGIDTGPIYEIRPVPRRPGMGIDELNAESVNLGLDMLLDAVDAMEKGGLQAKTPSGTPGSQYFSMHDYLREVLEYRIGRRSSG